MKKLLTFASVAMVACAVNAASFTWGFFSDEIKGPTGSSHVDEYGYLTGGTAFLYLGAATTSGTTLNIAGLTLLAYAGQNGESAAVPYSFGNFDTSALTSSDALAKTDARQAYTLILVENSGLTTADGYAGNYIAVTGSSVEASIPSAGDTVYYAQFVNDTAFGASSWTSGKIESVPEPTSGLLLLLGMAGLALKRKRA